MKNILSADFLSIENDQSIKENSLFSINERHKKPQTFLSVGLFINCLWFYLPNLTYKTEHERMFYREKKTETLKGIQ